MKLETTQELSHDTGISYQDHRLCPDIQVDDGEDREGDRALALLFLHGVGFGYREVTLKLEILVFLCFVSFSLEYYT